MENESSHQLSAQAKVKSRREAFLIGGVQVRSSFIDKIVWHVGKFVHAFA
jgi:hypothetical protein